MSKSQDTKKAAKKEPAKSMKEKKAAKQAKKSEKNKFKPQWQAAKAGAHGYGLTFRQSRPLLCITQFNRTSPENCIDRWWATPEVIL